MFQRVSRSHLWGQIAPIAGHPVDGQMQNLISVSENVLPGLHAITGSAMSAVPCASCDAFMGQKLGHGMFPWQHQTVKLQTGYILYKLMVSIVPECCKLLDQLGQPFHDLRRYLPMEIQSGLGLAPANNIGVCDLAGFFPNLMTVETMCYPNITYCTSTVLTIIHNAGK